MLPSVNAKMYFQFSYYCFVLLPNAKNEQKHTYKNYRKHSRTLRMNRTSWVTSCLLATLNPLFSTLNALSLSYLFILFLSLSLALVDTAIRTRSYVWPMKFSLSSSPVHTRAHPHIVRTCNTCAYARCQLPISSLTNKSSKFSLFTIAVRIWSAVCQRDIEKKNIQSQPINRDSSQQQQRV